MKKWYLLNYVDHIDWLIDNFEKLNIDCNEALFLITIQFFIKHNIPITIEKLSQKLKMDSEKINSITEQLSRKQYLNLTFSKDGIEYDLSKLYETNFSNTKLHSDDLFSLFQEEFGNLFNTNDAYKLKELLAVYPRNKIIKALQLAKAYEKTNMAYIEKILKDEQKK